MRFFIFYIFLTIILPNKKVFSQENDFHIFNSNFGENISSTLQKVYLSNLPWRKFENLSTELDYDSETNTKYWHFAPKFSTVMARENEKLFGTSYYRQLLSFVNNQYFSQTIELKYEDRRAATKVYNALKEYFKSQNYAYEEVSHPIDVNDPGTIVESRKLYQNKEERENNFSQCKRVKIELHFYKEKKYDFNLKEHYYKDYVSVLVEHSGYPNLALIRGPMADENIIYPIIIRRR